MNKKVKEDQDKNLVMFPASRYFTDGLLEEDHIDQLLNEFVTEKEEQISECREETDSIRKELHWGRMKRSELVELVSQQIDLLVDANKRLNYYLRDIENNTNIDE